MRSVVVLPNISRRKRRHRSVQTIGHVGQLNIVLYIGWKREGFNVSTCHLFLVKNSIRFEIVIICKGFRTTVVQFKLLNIFRKRNNLQQSSKEIEKTPNTEKVCNGKRGRERNRHK